MTEAITQPTSPTPEATPSQTQTQAVDKRDWKAGYKDFTNVKSELESSKDEKEFFGKVLKGHQNLASKLGQPKEEVVSVKDIAEYELPEQAEWFGKIALENKLSKDQVKSLETKFNEHIQGVLDEQNKAFDEALKKEWGSDYENNLITAKAFLASNLKEDDVKSLNGLDNTSLLILSKTALSLHKKYIGSSNVPSASGGAGSSVESLKSRLSEIMSDPDYLKPTMSNYQRRENLLKESVEIREKIIKLKG